MRDRADGPPDLLIVERAKGMAFAAGALVFPGGRVDPGDHALATALGGGEDLPARIAAIREGRSRKLDCPSGLTPIPGAAALASIRRALHAGEAFADALAAADIALDPDALVPFAQWRPAHRHLRIFDTRFYLAALPEGSPEPSADEGETVRLFWASAATVLSDADAGRATIIYPTPPQPGATGIACGLCGCGRRCGRPSGRNDHPVHRAPRGRRASLYPGRPWLSGHVGIADPGNPRLSVSWRAGAALSTFSTQ